MMMPTIRKAERNTARFFLTALALILGPIPSARAGQDPPQLTTAWNHSKFNLDVAGVVGRSNIVLQSPNLEHEQAMPLGNGRLGVAVWSEDGLTTQLNRADTLPLRLSPGQVVLPGLKKLTAAADYGARLDLYDGEFIEHGAGMTATVYVQSDADVLVIEVKGADPNTPQTAVLRLWTPRNPKINTQGDIGVVSELWKDSIEAGASENTFGSLAAVTAQGRDVSVAHDGPLGVKVSFFPNRDGSFRILVTSPRWSGGDAVKAARKLLPHRLAPPAQHRLWWHDFWNHVGLMKLHSADHSAEYMENLRLIDLYTAAAESLGPIPGSQAGIGDLFSSLRDQHQWGPSAFWHWNLRMQVAANLGAGAYRLNDSYFSLYRDNLQNMKAWTHEHMNGRPGICVPETMRFNGQGFENETWLHGGAPLNCAADFKPYYNARTITTGAEVSLWIWRQYLATGDRTFLAANYPVMAASARFLLNYAAVAADGTLHTYPANAHENQWDVHDPTTDIAAMRALFPVVMQAAELLKTDSDLTRQIGSAIPRLLPFPRVDEAQTKLLTEADATGHDVVAASYDPGAPIHNTENTGLEPVWPYSLVGDSGPLHDLALRTYLNRPNKMDNDWSNDPIHAARLGLPEEVRSTLLELTEKYQAYPSGLAQFIGPEFYVEQIGVVAAALQEALVQDYDGIVRVAPAWPKDWDIDGVVYIQHRSKVDVQMRGGVPVTVVIEAGLPGLLRVRNPWPGMPVEVVSGEDGHHLVQPSTESILEVPVEGGKAYVVEPAGHPLATLPFSVVSGVSGKDPKVLGTRSIGTASPAAK
jgi:alpha-L-fucosidase 2